MCFFSRCNGLYHATLHFVKPYFELLALEHGYSAFASSSSCWYRRICLAIISSVKLLVPSRHFRISPSKRSKACCAVLIFFSTEARLDFCRFDSCLIRFSAILEYGVSLICSNIFDTACRTIASTLSARYNACPSQSLPLYSSVPAGSNCTLVVLSPECCHLPAYNDPYA